LKGIWGLNGDYCGKDAELLFTGFPVVENTVLISEDVNIKTAATGPIMKISQ
jgi:hypothetical protein